MIGRKSIIVKTLHLGAATLLSRFFGFFREVLLARFLGAGALADAFHTAFMIPNTLRKVFAEGALSAALGPTLIAAERKEGHGEGNALVTLTLLVSQSCLLVLCIGMSVCAPGIIRLSAPGFTSDQVALGGQLARILAFFILFISSSAVLASALQAAHRFLVPANSPLLNNILWIVQLLMCLHFKLSLSWFAYAIVFDGFVLLLFHLMGYRYAGLSFAWPTRTTFAWFRLVMKKFLPCLITAGSMEISLVIDRILASYLPSGSIALLSYTSAFLRVPLGVLVAGFATILLSRMTNIGAYAPKRLGYYLLESSKLVAWVMLPSMLLMMVFSYKIFYTLLLSNSFTLESVEQASRIFIAFATGLFFFALNKILTNIFYALHNSLGPTVITLAGAVCNTVLNVIFMRYWGAVGIALATSFAGAFQTILFLGMLHYWHGISLYIRTFGVFLLRVIFQLFFGSALFLSAYYALYRAIAMLPAGWSHFFLDSYGFWLWVGPLCAALAGLLLLTRKLFRLRIYFLD